MFFLRTPSNLLQTKQLTVKMLNKQVKGVQKIIAKIPDGATVMIGGFGESGAPLELIHALIDHGARNLTIINNNAGNGFIGLASLIENHQVKKIVCSYPRSSNSKVFNTLYTKKEIELELVPQGTLAERIRCGGCGIPAFYTATGVDTLLEKTANTQYFDGKKYQLEYALKADFSLIKADKADYYGNLTYHLSARNFNPLMATAAKTTIVQAKQVVPPGQINPEHIITPGIFVQAVVEVKTPQVESELIKAGFSYLASKKSTQPLN